MIHKSYILTDEDDNIKNFKSLSYINHNIKKLSPECLNFSFYNGDVYLNELDAVYLLDLIKEKCDIVLPKNPKPMNYVILMQELNIINTKLAFNNYQRIKIYGNKNNIMALSEPMICDVPFVCLKLIFVDQAQGWVIS